MNNLLPLTDTGSIEITQGSGCFLYDKDGNRYIDLESGVWSVPLGHNHKRINRIISRQLERVIHLGYQVTSGLPERLSEALLNKLRMYGGRSVFLSSGSEAVDLSIAIAKHLTQRNLICKIDGSYLSAYGHGSNGIHNKKLVSLPNNDFEKLSACNFSEIAAFVFDEEFKIGVHVGRRSLTGCTGVDDDLA